MLAFGVSLPFVSSQFSFIRDQLLMRRFLMLKMFLTASATSMCVMTLLPFVSAVARTRIAASARVMSVSLAGARGLPSLAIGGALLGTGMAMCGSCPGTVFAQVASGSQTAWWILLGGILAAAAYTLVDMIPGFNSLLKFGGVAAQKTTLPQALGAKSIAVVALPIAAAFIVLVGTIDSIAPWKADVASILASAPAGVEPPLVIPPYLAGLIVGLLQVPLVLFVGQHLGCSSSYVTVVAAAIHTISPATCDRVPLLRSLRSNYWQVFLMAGVSLGAFASSTITNGAFASDALVSRTEALIGGALLVTGARLTAGCTSGHGISGMGYLAVNSFIAVAAMFAAGIATAFIAYA